MIAAKVIGLFTVLAFVFPNFLTSLENEASQENGKTKYSVGPTNISQNPYLVRNKRFTPPKKIYIEIKGYTSQVFVDKHIRKGYCLGLPDKYNSFMDDLKNTARTIDNFKGRRKQTYILSPTKSQEEIGKCIGDYVTEYEYKAKWVESFYPYYFNLIIEIPKLEQLCDKSSIYVAAITINNWNDAIPGEITCECGKADFKVGYRIEMSNITDNYIVDHLANTGKWREDVPEFRPLYNALKKDYKGLNNKALYDYHMNWIKSRSIKCK